MTDDTEQELLALAARLRAVEERQDADVEVAGAINDKLDELLAEQAAAPSNFHWPDLPDDERQAKWTGFLAWVQNVLIARYPDAADTLLACWWEHTEVVDEVTSCWFTWLGAYKNGQAAGTDSGNWHRTYLPGMLGRVEAALNSCGRGHKPGTPNGQAMSTVPTSI